MLKPPRYPLKGVAVSALHAFRGIAVAVTLTMPVVVLADQARPSPSRQAKSANTIESKSAELAVQFAEMLGSMRLSNWAAPHADRYVGAMLMPGVQLLVVGGKLASTARMDYLIAEKNYKEAYQDLNIVTERETRILISDLGADGLKFKREKDQPFDVVDVAGKQLFLDGKWGGKEGVSREEYTKTYESTDERYAEMLQALIDALKKSS
jgi:hypothetical protein